MTGLALHVNKGDDGELSFQGGAPYALPLGQTVRDMSTALAKQLGLVSREAVYKIEEAIQTTHQYLPHLSHAEPEHTVFDKTMLLQLLASKYGYKR